VSGKKYDKSGVDVFTGASAGDEQVLTAVFSCFHMNEITNKSQGSHRTFVRFPQLDSCARCLWKNV
jgi:hypothetical protein